MSLAKLILVTILATTMTFVLTQPALASSQEFTIQKNGAVLLRERSADMPKTSLPEMATLRVFEGGIDTTKTTPTGKQFEWGIPSKNSPTTRTFEVHMDGQVSLLLHQESGAIIVQLDGTAVALIESPWAKDVNGLIVPTYFTVHGNRFTQHVETNAGEYAYPITADPRFSWGIVSGHAYFSKEETRRVAAGAAAAAAISPFWVLVPPPAGPAIGYWWSSNSYTIAVWATAAVAQNKCLVLKLGVTGTEIPPSIGVAPDHYTDGCV